MLNCNDDYVTGVSAGGQSSSGGDNGIEAVAMERTQRASYTNSSKTEG